MNRLMQKRAGGFLQNCESRSRTFPMADPTDALFAPCRDSQEGRGHPRPRARITAWRKAACRVRRTGPCGLPQGQVSL